MSVSVKLTRADSFFDVALKEDLSPEAQSRALAGFARAGIDAASRTNARILGGPPRLTIAVDGRSGASLESVRPTGRIVAEFELIDEVLRWIAQTLVDRSPVLSGAYVRGHRLYADGREIEVRAGQPVPAAAEYVLLNLVPYARKVEIGKTRAGRPFLLRVPNRVYERTARAAAARFGNVATIRFSYRAPMAGAIAPYVAIGRGGRKSGPRPDAGTRSAASVERSRRVPAIIVKPRS